MFRAVDGLYDTYATAVTVSPRGNIWVRHDDPTQVSVFDGYRIQKLPAPGQERHRVYESRTGQLWTLHPSGLMVYSGTEWVEHVIPEIRALLNAVPYSERRHIALVPAERDRVLFLLADRLMEYDAFARKTVVLKPVTETGLGRFLDMAESRDGGIWITGAQGVLKLAGPLRHLRPGATGQEFLAEESLGARFFQRPFERASGTLTMAAIDPRVEGRRRVVRFDGRTWTVTPVDLNIRQAWSAWDDVRWAYTVNSLLRFDPPPGNSAAREKLWAGQYNDVGTETNDVFWLATSEGLLRYAPSIWRTPVELEDANSHVHAIIEDSSGTLWMASGDALISARDGQIRQIRWPEGLEGSFDARDPMFQLPDGRIAIGAGSRTFLFEPSSATFTSIVHPTGQRSKLLGQLADGGLAFQVFHLETNHIAPFVVERFDGSSFEAFAQGPSDWNYGAELFFLTPLSNGDIWIGASGGAARIRNGVIEVFGPANGFREPRALCLTDVGDGKLWCGGPGGILEYSGKSWEPTGPKFDRVHAIRRAPDQRIWVASASGLFCYAAGFWMQHGVEEGLPSLGVSEVFVDSRGALWSGTTRGPSRFHPEADQAPPRTLEPLVEGGANGVAGGKTTILFNGMDKWHETRADRLLFATRLDDQQWSPFTNAVATSFERIGAGKHRLEVRAMDRNWNQDPAFAVLDFTVVLPWHQDPRLIAAVLSGAVLVSLFAALAINRHLRLIRSYAEVERIVNLRTRELARANEELLQAQKMRAVGTLAASIAHDFNNILSIIRGSAQIIQGNLEDKQKILTRLTRIQAVVEQGAGIVKSVLGLSRVKEKDFVPMDLNSVIEDGIRLLGDRFLPEVNLRFAPAEGLPPVCVAPELLRQILINLILNAADAMEHRGEIVVSTDQLFHLPPKLALAPTRASSHLCFAVQDAGCGIEPEVLPRIFEPFFTTKALSARRGTGLGL